MSPEFAFILTLGFRMAITAAFVVSASVITERSGPLITRRWYDIPLRAALVATLVATVVTASGWVGPKISGIIALFPIVFTSLMLILHPRIGGPPTAAVVANGAWGLMGFGLAVAVLHLATLRFGAVIGLSLALATCVSWNLGLWWNGRRRAVKR